MALALSAAVIAPYTALWGCGGDACCEMQMAEQSHHGTTATITGDAASPVCPMLACGVASSALTIESSAIVPDVAASDLQTPLLLLTYTSAARPPRTPPPRV